MRCGPSYSIPHIHSYSSPHTQMGFSLNIYPTVCPTCLPQLLYWTFPSSSLTQSPSIGPRYMLCETLHLQRPVLHTHMIPTFFPYKYTLLLHDLQLMVTLTGFSWHVRCSRDSLPSTNWSKFLCLCEDLTPGLLSLCLEQTLPTTPHRFS